ncbi:MAG TPA: hypothetical protein VMB48_04305 [Steroidobacteraceae bacterium]|nr:hypothetical protein [Steroidobacteraceae bacterium]
MTHQARSYRDAVVLTPAAAPTASVIWLHGLGADGNDFPPLVPELRLPVESAVRFVFPHAPVRPITINGGVPMRAWFDIYPPGGTGHEDAQGIHQSAAQVDTLIQRERATGIPAQRILLAGFSQGGALALQAGLRYGERLAGVLALSTWLPLAGTLAAQASAANRDLPVLMCHGSADPIVPVELGRRSRDVLQELGYPVVWKEYAMQHQLCGEEVADIGAWLRERLP